MPLLEYVCKKCGKKTEELVKNSSTEVRCHDCGEIMERDYNGKVYSGLGVKSSGCTGDCKHCSGCK